MDPRLHQTLRYPEEYEPLDLSLNQARMNEYYLRRSLELQEKQYREALQNYAYQTTYNYPHLGMKNLPIEGAHLMLTSQGPPAIYAPIVDPISPPPSVTAYDGEFKIPQIPPFSRSASKSRRSSSSNNSRMKHRLTAQYAQIQYSQPLVPPESIPRMYPKPSKRRSKNETISRAAAYAQVIQESKIPKVSSSLDDVYRLNQIQARYNPPPNPYLYKLNYNDKPAYNLWPIPVYDNSRTSILPRNPMPVVCPPASDTPEIIAGGRRLPLPLLTQPSDNTPTDSKYSVADWQNQEKPVQNHVYREPIISIQNQTIPSNDNRKSFDVPLYVDPNRDGQEWPDCNCNECIHFRRYKFGNMQNQPDATKFYKCLCSHCMQNNTNEKTLIMTTPQTTTPTPTEERASENLLSPAYDEAKYLINFKSSNNPDDEAEITSASEPTGALEVYQQIHTQYAENGSTIPTDATDSDCEGNPADSDSVVEETDDNEHEDENQYEAESSEPAESVDLDTNKVRDNNHVFYQAIYEGFSEEISVTSSDNEENETENPDYSRVSHQVICDANDDEIKITEILCKQTKTTETDDEDD